MSNIIKAFNFPLLTGNSNLPFNDLYHNCISKLLKAGHMATIRPGSSLHYCTLFLLIVSRGMSKFKTSSVLVFSMRKLTRRIKVFEEGQRVRQKKVIEESIHHGTILNHYWIFD